MNAQDEFNNKVLTLFQQWQDRLEELQSRVKTLEDQLARREVKSERRARRSYATWQRIQELRSQGSGARAIASLIALPVSTVYKYLQTPEDKARELGKSTSGDDSDEA